MKTFFVAFFSSLNLWHESRSASFNPVVTPQAKIAPHAKLVPQKLATGPEPCHPMWDEDFFLVFTPEFKGKNILCLPNIVRVPLPPVTLLWRRARLYGLSILHVHLKKTKDIIKNTAHQHRKTRGNSRLTIVNICSD